jgi:hypothetical protein
MTDELKKNMLIESFAKGIKKKSELENWNRTRKVRL